MLPAEYTPTPAISELNAPEARHWYALHTASNNEKRVGQHLRRREIECFLPLYTVVRKWKNRVTARVELPLFAGYVFARLGSSEMSRALSVPMVYSIVGNSKHPLPLPDHEIETLRAGLHARDIDPYPYVTVGKRARITSGALAGLEGVVVRKDDHWRVVLSIDLIKKSVAVHVEAHELQPCE